MQNYHMSAKVCRNVFSDVLKKRNLAAIPLILIPENSQSNAIKVSGKRHFSLLLQCSFVL